MPYHNNQKNFREFESDELEFGDEVANQTFDDSNIHRMASKPTKFDIIMDDQGKYQCISPITSDNLSK